MKDDIIGVVSAFRPYLFQGKSTQSSEWDQEVTIASQRNEPAGDKIYSGCNFSAMRWKLLEPFGAHV